MRTKAWVEKGLVYLVLMAGGLFQSAAADLAHPQLPDGYGANF